MAKYSLGLDIGSSSVKGCLLSLETGSSVSSIQSPENLELKIESPVAGHAEQHPDVWWEHVRLILQRFQAQGHQLRDIASIGISYQMHGLVLVDKSLTPVRSAIIWCDSRAVPYGQRAFESLGANHCLENYFNSPGNFTAAKLAWVKEREPEIFKKAAYLMLPGDYIASKLSGEASTTALGLSEGILWDFREETPAKKVMEFFGIPESFIPRIAPTFAVQCQVSSSIAGELGLKAGTPISYRAGDQQNNALSLKVLEPGELAATAGTSGVVVGIGDQKRADEASRVNIFLHVNHQAQAPRYCTLLCVNGTGVVYSWLRRLVAATQSNLPSYESLNTLAQGVPVGSDGLSILPYGNGAERSLGNRSVGASLSHIDFNRHSVGHVIRAAQEGIVFALCYGLEIMQGIGIQPNIIKAGKANLFQSTLFREAFAATTGATIQLCATDGAEGAARGAGIGAGIFKSVDEAFKGFNIIQNEEPRRDLQSAYRDSYGLWKKNLERQLKN